MKLPASVRQKPIFLALTSIFVLAGCGGGGGGGAANSATGAVLTAYATGPVAVPAPAPVTTSPPVPTTPPVNTGPCSGSPTPAPSAIILPPSVPQAVAATDIVGVNLQNTTAADLPAHVFTFGQIFKSGQVQRKDALVARIGGAAYQVQLDALSSWPDGSVKLGSLTLTTPAICNKSTLPVLLSKATSSDPVFSSTQVNLALAPLTLSATMAFSAGQYSGTQNIDLGAALKTALASNPVYWLQGPLATQARVDVPLAGGALHVTADVTAYADGSVGADVQFNNDLTTILPHSGSVNPQAALSALQYTATVKLQSKSASHTVSQVQYADWHLVLNSVDAPQNFVSSGAAPAINVQHDLAYLEHSAAILPYDRTTGVANLSGQNPFSSIAGILSGGGFGAPFSNNGVEKDMPMTGGRPDIGFTTMWNTVWLVTQDARAATVALAQGDASGAVPWNFKLANGHWLTPGDYPAIWTDTRGGPQTSSDGIANRVNSSVWISDSAHQPNLAYVPYIMTGARWYLDRLNAQAAFSIDATAPFTSGPYQASGRYAGRLTNMPNASQIADIVISPGNQQRGSAWSLREIQEAGWIGYTGSFEQIFFAQAANDNWNYFLALKPALTAQQGEAAGWLPGTYGAFGKQIIMPPWQQDYFTGVAAIGAGMGYPGALDYLKWQKDGWLTGRFNAPDMNPYDGTVYNMVMTDTTGAYYTTWAAIETGTATYSKSNGSAFATGNGYAQWARGALGATLTFFPGDSNLLKALSFLQQHGTYVDAASLQADPTFNVVPLQ